MVLHRASCGSRLLVTALLLAGSVPAPSTARAEEEDTPLTLGVRATLIPTGGSCSFRGADAELDLSGGLGVYLDYARLPFLAMGLLLDYQFLLVRGDTGVGDHTGHVNIDGALKLFFDLTSWMGIYIKFAAGMTVGIPPAYAPEAEAAVGWNVQLLPGVMFRLRQMQFSLEPGGLFSGWTTEEQGARIDFKVQAFMLSFCAAWIF